MDDEKLVNDPAELEKLVREIAPEDLKGLIPKLTPLLEAERPDLMEKVYQLLWERADSLTFAEVTKIIQMERVNPTHDIDLREQRLSLGLTQQQVADRAGIRIQHYQGFEGGQRNLKTASFIVACSVLEALDLDISDYFHGGHAVTVKPDTE